MSFVRRLTLLSLVLVPVGARVAAAQVAADIAAPIKAPATPLPSETSTAALTKYSFISYGDTRGRHDGSELQAEHTLVMEAMLAEIKKASTTSDPIRFVLQSGDAVVNGSIAPTDQRQLQAHYRTADGRQHSVFSVGGQSRRGECR